MNLIQCIQKPEAKGGIFFVVLFLTLSGNCLIFECTFADKTKWNIFKDQRYIYSIFFSPNLLFKYQVHKHCSCWTYG